MARVLIVLTMIDLSGPEIVPAILNLFVPICQSPLELRLAVSKLFFLGRCHAPLTIISFRPIGVPAVPFLKTPCWPLPRLRGLACGRLRPISAYLPMTALPCFMTARLAAPSQVMRRSGHLTGLVWRTRRWRLAGCGFCRHAGSRPCRSSVLAEGDRHWP